MIPSTLIALVTALFARMADASPATGSDVAAGSVTIKNNNPLIYFHGRWDASPGTWWTGSGFKLHASGLISLSLVLGEHTTSPYAAVGVSVNYGPFQSFNATAGVNHVPLGATSPHKTSVVRVNVEGWQNNRINLEDLILNKGAKLLPYEPSPINLQFIGDSLSAGQFLTDGVNGAWPFLVAEAFKAESQINAAPGAALSNIPSYGNMRGVSHQFFKVEDMGFYYSTDHNYTTNWDFSLEKPKPTHVVIEIGANDASWNVSGDAFAATLASFIDRLRIVYPTQPIFLLTPWGWPSPDGSLSYYYDGRYQEVIDQRKLVGDDNTFLIDATGWIGYEDVFVGNIHPNAEGHQKIAGKFVQALESWGLKPQKSWATSV